MQRYLMAYGRLYYLKTEIKNKEVSACNIWFSSYGTKWRVRCVENSQCFYRGKLAFVVKILLNT